jgi:hypothetical protein
MPRCASIAAARDFHLLKSADSLGAGGLRGIGRSYTSLRPAPNRSTIAAPATRRVHMQPRARVPPSAGRLSFALLDQPRALGAARTVGVPPRSTPPRLSPIFLELALVRRVHFPAPLIVRTRVAANADWRVVQLSSFSLCVGRSARSQADSKRNRQDHQPEGLTRAERGCRPRTPGSPQARSGEFRLPRPDRG